MIVIIDIVKERYVVLGNTIKQNNFAGVSASKIQHLGSAQRTCHRGLPYYTSGAIMLICAISPTLCESAMVEIKVKQSTRFRSR